MYTPLGTFIFWMITVGLIAGFGAFYLFRERGVSLALNIVMGLLGSCVAGFVGYIFGFGTPLAFSVVGAVAFLFVANAFHKKSGEVPQT